jgi:glycosyltransferase involved in cell wall biosynthesis
MNVAKNILVVIEVVALVERTLRPLILVTYEKKTGSVKRTQELLRRGKAFGIEYIIALEREAYFNAIKSFPSFLRTLHQRKVYLVDLGAGKGHIHSYKKIISAAIILSKIIRREKADLVFTPAAAYRYFLTACFAANISRVPWTAIMYYEDILGPVKSKETINLLKLINNLIGQSKLSVPARVKSLLELLLELRIAEKTPMLAVSEIVGEQLRMLNSKLKFRTINPGVGIDLALYKEKRHITKKYDAIFFARLVPEKGLYDVVTIWKLVVQRNPKALLAVAGIVIDAQFVEHFQKMVTNNSLSNNVVFLGEQREDQLIQLIKSSSVVLYPARYDTFSLVILESLACGKPVITYDIPASRNYGECKAVLIQPIGNISAMAKSILNLLQDQNRISKLSEEAILFSERYDWNHVVEAEKEAYIDIINLHASKSNKCF